ncbi:hypothetical protein Tco_0158541 [Tanacetum coccineum]
MRSVITHVKSLFDQPMRWIEVLSLKRLNKFDDEPEEPWSENGVSYEIDQEWDNNLMDGSSKDEALEQKAIYEESWGNAKQSVINFCGWLKMTFRNFHELDYELLEKLQDYWWKVNNRECSPFANWRDYIRGPYANYYSTGLQYKKIRDDQVFGDDEKYVAVKEDEYDDLTSTSEDACRAYQEIFLIMDEGWTVTRADYRKLKKNSNLKTLL